MIDYRWFRADEIAALGSGTFAPQVLDLVRKALADAKNWKPADAIVLVALDRDKLAGHVKFTYGHVAKLGEKLRVAAAQDLFTSPDYRGRGIGSTLIQKSLAELRGFAPRSAVFRRGHVGNRLIRHAAR